MILYHGSNAVFKKPLLSRCSPHKDFGRGFYLSDSFDVARRTALRTVRQHGGEPFVMVFEIDEKKMRQLPFKKFAQPGNRAWAKFVLVFFSHACRFVAACVQGGSPCLTSRNR